MAVVPLADTAWLADLVVVGGEVVPFGVRMALTWLAALVVVGGEAVPFGVCTALARAVSASIGPGRLDSVPPVPPAILLAVPLNLTDLPTPGRLVGAVGNCLDAGASGGGSLQLEKSIGGRPGGGGMYPDIPAAVVLGAVMPPEEAVTPYPGDSSTTWLHDGGGCRRVGSHADAPGG